MANKKNKVKFFSLTENVNFKDSANFILFLISCILIITTLTSYTYTFIENKLNTNFQVSHNAIDPNKIAETNKPQALSFSEIFKTIYNIISFYIKIASNEELWFRIIPLSLVIYFFRKNLYILYSTMFATSIIFGYVHGGIFNILLQGLSGLSFAVIFVRCGGLKKDYIRGGLSAISAHFLYDIMIILAYLFVQIFLLL